MPCTPTASEGIVRSRRRADGQWHDRTARPKREKQKFSCDFSSKVMIRCPCYSLLPTPVVCHAFYFLVTVRRAENRCPNSPQFTCFLTANCASGEPRGCSFSLPSNHHRLTHLRATEKPGMTLIGKILIKQSLKDIQRSGEIQNLKKGDSRLPLAFCRTVGRLLPRGSLQLFFARTGVELASFRSRSAQSRSSGHVTATRSRTRCCSFVSTAETEAVPGSACPVRPV